MQLPAWASSITNWLNKLGSITEICTNIDIISEREVFAHFLFGLQKLIRNLKIFCAVEAMGQLSSIQL